MSRRYSLTDSEVFALSASAVYAACNLTNFTTMSVADQATMQRMNAMAAELLAKSGLTATEVKDLGLDLLRKMMRT